MEEELDSKQGLLNAGYVEIAINVWGKGKKIFARCNDCSMIRQIPFDTIKAKTKKVVFSCNSCVSEAVRTYERALLKTKW